MQGFFLVLTAGLTIWAVSLQCGAGDGVCSAQAEGRGMVLVLFVGLWIFVSSVILLVRALGEVGQAVRARRSTNTEPAGVTGSPRDPAAPAPSDPDGRRRTGGPAPP